MRFADEKTVNRYVRLLVHDHPLRSYEYLKSIVERGMSEADVARYILSPARARVLKMRAAHLLNSSDTNAALSLIRKALTKLSTGDRLLRADIPAEAELPVSDPADLAEAPAARP